MVKYARYIMLATNALISENEVFVDMIKNHIRDGIPFEEEDMMQWDKEEIE